MKHAPSTGLPYSVVLKPNPIITAYPTATDVVDMATPASQLAAGSHPSSHRAAAAQPRKGAKKLASPTAVASFHLRRNTSGSSSAPARNVRTIAPMPERNLTQDSSVPSNAAPTAAPMISCAIVPTTISDNAVEMRSQIDSKLAIKASPSQSAASAHTPVMLPPHVSGTPRPHGPAAQQKTRLAAGHGRTPTACLAVGVISRCRRFRGTPSPSSKLLSRQ